jgi:hypothetical protein
MIKSKWVSGVHEGNVVSFLDGKRFFIHLRPVLMPKTYPSGDIEDRHGRRVLTVLIDDAQKVEDHMYEALAQVKHDDVVVLIYASDETRMAALAVLGLGEA